MNNMKKEKKGRVVGCGAWLSSCFIGICFQPCLYPMQTVHPRILYTPAREGGGGAGLMGV
jgi:hypothetical protein